MVLSKLPRIIDELKRSEERRVRNQVLVCHAWEVVREWAPKLGLACCEMVDEIIFNMAVENFPRLAHEFPTLSRVDFKPVKQDGEESHGN